MIKHFPVSNILSMYTHILISITISITMYISVNCFKTVNASGNLYKIYNLNNNLKNQIKMKTIKYVMSISLGLITLSFIEALFTFGNAFILSNYNLFGWVMQAIVITFTVSLSIIICNNMINKGEL